MIDRRTFIKGVASQSALAPLATTSLIVSSERAEAAYVALITAAISVVQAIAAANRGDGGLGASLSAINGKLDIAIQQLAAIQNLWSL
jgi:hypothetical protein